MQPIDEISLSKTVMFAGEYFSLMTTVVLDEALRQEGEGDYDFAVRLASVFMKEYYGFDVASVSQEIGVEFEDEDE